jgi:tetratricopeptide (TPR) repeat protein
MSRWLAAAGSRPAVLLVALGLTMGLAWFVYWPGLTGGFLFDDYSNLALLGTYGHIDDWQSFWLYLLSGFSGPTGRPLSHLSFLMDANFWPADPWPFKRSNVLIHLVIGALLFGLLRSLLLAADQQKARAGWIALLAMTLWLLHPFWVSTTLYVVQRMAQLAALFTVAGLWLWVSWRWRRSPQGDWQTWLVALLAVWGFGLLAVLSKENGALLPVFVLVLEVTVLAAMDERRGCARSAGFGWLKRVVLGIPLLLLALYFVQAVPALLTGEAGSRTFTPFERLLTEGRILWDYVFNIVLPQPYPGGLFNDGIRVSAGLFTPWFTAVAWAAWLALGVWAVQERRRYPLLAAAVLFFLAGHLLESSFWQLELYFEHRNYLPAMLAGLPLANWWLARVSVPTDIRIAVPVGVVLLLAAMTFMRADLWSSPYLQALKWAQVNPESPRAQHNLADFWWEVGNYDEAVRLNDRAIALDPNGLAWLMTRVMYQCAQRELPAAALAEVESVLRAKERVGAVGTYQAGKLLDYLMSGNCGRLSEPDELQSLISRLQQAEKGDTRQFGQLLLQRRATLLLQQGQVLAAYNDLRELLAASGEPGTQLRGAAMLASAGHYQSALELLDESLAPQPNNGGFSIKRLRDAYLQQTHYYEYERQVLRETIREDLGPEQKQNED